MYSQEIYPQEIEAYIARKHKFLVDDWGFKAKPLEIINLSSITKYRRDDIGIDIQYEYLMRAVFTVLVRVKDGVDPGRGFMKHGEVVRSYLHEVLIDQGQTSRDEVIREGKIYQKKKKKEKAKGRANEFLHQRIDSEAAQLQKYMPLIMEHKDSLFDTPRTADDDS